ncbi:hypothetical protein THTE_2374 [Thermogutta terrifontis]|uniref:Uncharacterized protein n=1 Tax=Thermogutta terrifontis TaxID=1331910 RepID=A0A286RG96_9BACT|nr:hypothetical protein THTE_2374 [Thermogutta terrifontis]
MSVKVPLRPVESTKTASVFLKTKGEIQRIRTIFSGRGII